MNAAAAPEVLVVLTSPPALESQLVDWLLGQEDGAGFSGVAVRGHSTRHEHLSVAEQVSGWQRRHQFQIQLPGRRLDAFLEDLKARFSGADLHYWVLPVIAGGHLA